MGSSPLARGTRQVALCIGDAIGLIPARAGNTTLSHTSTIWPGAHPRSRGEHAGSLGEQVAAAGSSPLARGTLLPFALLHPACGLIPARAGNTEWPGY